MKIEDTSTVFSFIRELDWMEGGKFIEVSQEIIDNNSEDEEELEILNTLLGYEVKFDSSGSHHNDGQLVDYTFYFKNPEGSVTEIDTRMCLMVGWNHNEDIEIN